MYGDPDKFMRDYLGMADDEVLEMIKPPFGDPRSPRLWNAKACKTLAGGWWDELVAGLVLDTEEAECWVKPVTDIL